MKNKKILTTFSTIFLCFIFNSCETNKIVYITPNEPLYVTDGIFTFYHSPNLESWLDCDPSYAPLEFTIFLESEVIPTKIMVHSATLSIIELNIDIKIENLELLLENESEHLSNSFKEEYAPFYSIFDIENFNTELVRKAYSEEISKLELFNRFNKNKKAQLQIDYTYIIESKEHSSSVILNYQTRNVISSRCLDNDMSI